MELPWLLLLWGISNPRIAELLRRLDMPGGKSHTISCLDSGIKLNKIEFPVEEKTKKFDLLFNRKLSSIWAQAVSHFCYKNVHIKFLWEKITSLSHPHKSPTYRGKLAGAAQLLPYCYIAGLAVNIQIINI